MGASLPVPFNCAEQSRALLLLLLVFVCTFAQVPFKRVQILGTKQLDELFAPTEIASSECNSELNFSKK